MILTFTALPVCRIRGSARGWYFLAEGPVSAFGALIYGAATTVASQFLVFPSMGFGVFGRRSPEGIKAPLSSLANHSFFGLGMALVIALW